MNYEKKYKEALELARDYYKANLTLNKADENAVLEDIFPELKESEDEKIRKRIIHALHGDVLDMEETTKALAWLEKQKSVEEIVARCKDSWYNEGKIAGMAEGLSDDEKYQQGWHDAIEKQVPVDKDKVVKGVRRGIATFLINYIDANSKGMCLSNMECEDIEDAIVNNKWYKVYGYMKKKLEKQGEKPQDKTEEKTDNANKVEQKFKAGDWVILTAGELSITLQIVSVDTNKKLYCFNDSTYLPIVDEECLHLWTIEDAKEGDVLYSLDSKQPFIFKHRKTHEQAEVYCGINIYGKFFVGNTKDCIITTDKYIPATKEQRDKLLKAMADAGYTFNFEKKGLEIEQNPVWSEEDDYNVQCLAAKVTSDIQNGNVGRNQELIDWLKSIKDRVQPQNLWKPSEEQMDALEHFVRGIGESGYASPYDNNTKLIYSLLEQLKQL